jgi:ATP-dependent DNA helicase RecQ
LQQDIHSILKQYWGHSEFRPLQEEIIRTALEKQDCLALLPTGSGKSVCFQVPALAMEGICLVISPLIALMKDQVAQLRKKGISALAIHTGMPYKEVNKTLQLALNGQIKFLYLSPERLQTNLFKEYLLVLPVTLIAVDEAHCVSQWGYDFRPQYLQIASLREILPEVPILALTASATPLVQEDIMTQLQLKKAVVHKGSFIREALSYSCFEESSKLPKLFDIISKVEGSSIVYCRSRKRTVDICRFLNERGISATYYHAGLNQEKRNERQQQWTQNQVRIIVSTNAFGMGIDKPDVRTVVHYDVPDCLENYYQEAGRAGRDRQKAYAVLLYNQQDLIELKQQLEKKFPDLETIKKVYQAMANFLHLPTGTGEGQSFDFDLTLFCKNFDLDRMVAINALQLLQANGYCALNESVYEPARVQFVADRSWLEQVEKNYPALEPLIKTLLRTIEGIFSYPGMISETYLARLLRTERENIINQLKQLESLGIVNYEQARDQPQLVLLTERVKTENIQLDLKAIERRKKLAKERLDALFQYTIGNTCRSSFIGRYFGDAAIKDCGICDNCLEKKRKAAKPQKLQNKILNSLENGAKSITTLQAEIGDNANQQELLRVIRLLESEQLIRVQISGMVERL